MYNHTVQYTECKVHVCHHGWLTDHVFHLFKCLTYELIMNSPVVDLKGTVQQPKVTRRSNEREIKTTVATSNTNSEHINKHLADTNPQNDMWEGNKCASCFMVW